MATKKPGQMTPAQRREAAAQLAGLGAKVKGTPRSLRPQTPKKKGGGK